MRPRADTWDVLFLRYPFSFVVVTVAFVLTGGFFLFLRPQYHDPTPGKTIDLSGYPAASHGWTWKDGTPGFVVRTGHEDWNPSLVRPRELPHGARLLNALREPSGLSLLVARGRCIGAAVPDSVAWFCPPQLGPQVAFVAVDVVRPFADYDEFPLNIVGATRAGVVRVVLHGPSVTRTTPGSRYATTYGTGRVAVPIRGNWGTFVISFTDAYHAHHVPTRPWRMRLDFYGTHHRLLASKQLVFARPGAHLVVVK